MGRRNRVKSSIEAGDFVRCCGNVVYGKVIVATEQWVILVNEDALYLKEHPEDKGVEYAVRRKDIADIRYEE